MAFVIAKCDWGGGGAGRENDEGKCKEAESQTTTKQEKRPNIAETSRVAKIKMRNLLPLAGGGRSGGRRKKKIKISLNFVRE